MAKSKIPLSVSSTLNIPDPVSIPVLGATPYANEGRSGEAAPILLAIESADTVGADAFAARLPVRGGQGTSAQARLAVNAIAEVLLDLVGEYGGISVATPFGAVTTYISGSLENGTDAIDPETNKAYLGVEVPDEYRRLFASFEAFVPAGAAPVALKRVRDKATGVAKILGTGRDFYLEGTGMTVGGEGEKCELHSLSGERVCAIETDAATQNRCNIVCRVPAGTALATGDYKLALATSGGSDRLWPVQLKVRAEIAEPAGPTITKFCTGGENGILRPAQFVNIEGDFDAADAENLPVATGAYQGATRTVQWSLAQLQVNTGGKMVASYSTEPAFQFDDGAIVTMHFRGATKTAVYNPQS